MGVPRTPPRQDLKEDLHRIAEALSRFDLAELSDLLLSKGFCDDHAACKFFVIHLLRFFALTALHSDSMPLPYVCPEVMDRAWRAVLMVPRLYLRLCHLFLPSRVIAYYPFTSKTRGVEISEYAGTLSKYLVTFGRQPGTLYWPPGSPANKNRISGAAALPRRITASEIGIWTLDTLPLFQTGLVPSSLGPELRRLSSVIADSDLSHFFFFCYHYQISKRVSPDTCLVEFFRFLIIKVRKGDISSSSLLLPPPLVNFTWRTLLLFPQLYIPLCIRLLERDELVEREDKDRHGNVGDDPAYKRTVEAYTEIFGHAPPVSVWPPVARSLVVSKPIPERIQFTIEDSKRHRYGIKSDSSVLISVVLEQFAGALYLPFKVDLDRS